MNREPVTINGSGEPAALRRLAKYVEAKQRKSAKKAAATERRKQIAEAKKEKSRNVSRFALAVAGKAAAARENRESELREKEMEVESRLRQGICICCKDNCGVKANGYCTECWLELSHGVIPRLTISDRQIASAQCRIIRKGHEMS